MDTLEEARKKILKELTSDDADVRADYLKHFASDIEKFSEAMAHTVVNWHSLHAEVKDDENLGQISAWVISAITLHILSMKLFVSGHIVAAGNLFRQVVETVALALLCSAKLDVLDRVRNGKYSTNKAVEQLLRQAKQIGIDKEAVQALRDARHFYDNYSHPTMHTIWAGISSSEGVPYVGASFDDEKMEIYAKEIERRLDLASVFSNFVDAVKVNIGKC
jgi:tRNA U55 pseudouridine synthase TruB